MSKVLLIGLCDGTDVGEAWVGFQWAQRLAARHDVTLLTYYKRGRTPPSRQLPGARVIEWPEPVLTSRAERFNSMLKPATSPSTSRLAAGYRTQWARASTSISPTSRFPWPCGTRRPAAGLGIPLVIGPVGGSLPTPAGFGAEEDTAPWYVGLRRLDSLRMRRDPLLRRTYEQASCVLGIAPYVRDFLSGLSLRHFEVMSETGIDALPPPVDRRGRAGQEVRLLFVGRLIRTKGARDAIRALAIVRDLPVELDIVGDGFDRAECEALTDRLGLRDRVHFHGKVARSQVDNFYRAADIFLFPSFREPGGNVAFEAMGYGLPLIVSDNGGPGAAVDDSCGIRLSAQSPERYAADIAAAIARLAMDRDLRLALGDGARERVADIALWDSKVSHLEAIWKSVLPAQQA